MEIKIKDIENIVREASKLMLTESFDISQKGGYENIVTSSDLAVQDFLIRELSKLLPGSGFICEEKDVEDLGKEYTWIIDPIDGTANYSRNVSDCAICVGLKDNVGMKMAVIFISRREMLYTAERDKGAYLNGEPIHVSNRTFADAILCAALPVYHKEKAEMCSHIIADTFLQCNDIRRYGAAAPELCYIATGYYELYFEYLLSPWDFAAASLIIEEAGGKICNHEGQKIDMTKPSGVVAANNEENLQHFLEIIRRHKSAE